MALPDSAPVVQYEHLIPNLAQVHVEGSAVRVRWKCPTTGRIVGESTAWMAADDSIAARVGASVKRSVASEMIYGAARALSGILGGSIGRVINNAVYTAANDVNTKATAGADFTESSRRTAVVTAFETVKHEFAWDERTSRFVAREG